jgi:hypothetical protein
LAVDLDTRRRQRRSKAAAIAAPYRDLGAGLRNGVACVCRTRCRRRDLMLLQIVKAENACIAAENLVAGDPPDQLRRSVEMPDTEVAIDKDHGIARPLKCSQQELGTFYRRAIAGAHRPTLEAR